MTRGCDLKFILLLVAAVFLYSPVYAQTDSAQSPVLEDTAPSTLLSNDVPTDSDKNNEVLRQRPQSPREPTFSGYTIDEIPDEFIQEAISFSENCKSNAEMSRHHDCECMRTRHLETRLQFPFLSATAIVTRVQADCVDATGAAGFIYLQCLRSNPLFKPPQLTLEQYCACAGNQYAAIYRDEKPGSSPRIKMRIHQRALTDCRDVVKSRPFYQNWQ